MKIGHKLFVTLGVTIAVAAGAVSYVSLIRIGRLSRQLGSVYRDALLPLWNAKQAHEALEG